MVTSDCRGGKKSEDNILVSERFVENMKMETRGDDESSTHGYK